MPASSKKQKAGRANKTLAMHIASAGSTRHSGIIITPSTDCTGLNYKLLQSADSQCK
jgi:hypothetical protein